MAIFKYKTREQESPQAKPRVYFCCELEGFGYYFNSICDEILEVINCAIWYPEDVNAQRDDEYLDYLKQMQLFVMPITEEFLYTKNPVLEVDFPFAIKNHIPVLPILLDNKLVDDFNEICGNLQYLDRNNYDQTAISYKEKLEKTLLSLLISDDLSAKIRAAFDALVFLSYRKKDRKYAQELMRLIHRNDLYRDVAIWYDEFLVPGEDFDISIQNAINNSDLFVLTVAPNIVEDPNYIITKEYPAAKEIGKPILPLEILPTDRDAIKEKFNGISECTDAHDEKALLSALADCLKDVALMENRYDTEHTFFMGLAYLGGVNVEVDLEKGFKLIQDAAMEGLPQAMGKLAEIYQNGIGVEHDYTMAAVWQEDWVKKLKKDFDNAPDMDKFEQLFWAYMKLSELWEQTERIKDAEEVCKNAKDIAFYQYLKCSDDADIQLYLSRLIVANEKLAELGREKGLASLYYGAALDYVFDKYSNPDDIEYRRARALYYQKFADAFRIEKNYDIAQENFGYALEHARFLMVDNCQLKDKIVIANIYKGMAGVFHVRKKNEEAKAHYMDALNLLLTVAIESDSVSAKNELADCYAEYLKLHENEKNWAEVKKCYLKIFNLCEAVEEKTSTIKAKTKLAESCLNIADFYLDEEDFESAETYFKRALVLSEEILKINAVSEPYMLMCHSYMGLGNLHKVAGNSDEAKVYYQRMLKIVEYEIESWLFSSKKILKLNECLLENARIAIAEGDFDAAKELCDKAGSRYSSAVHDDYDKEDMRMDFAFAKADIYLVRGDLARAKGEYDRAVNCYDSAISCIRYYKYSDFYKFVEKNAEIYYRLYTSEERYAPSLDRAIECYEHLTSDCPHVKRYERQLKFLKGLKQDFNNV